MKHARPAAVRIVCPCCATEIELRTVPAEARKVCQRCHESLPVSAFGTDKASPGGIARRCKACEVARKLTVRRRGTAWDPAEWDEDDESAA